MRRVPDGALIVKSYILFTRIRKRYYLENPQNFTKKMIDKSLAKLPSKFKNQRLAFHIENFKEIKISKIFEHELIRTVEANANVAKRSSDSYILLIVILNLIKENWTNPTS